MRTRPFDSFYTFDQTHLYIFDVVVACIVNFAQCILDETTDLDMPCLSPNDLSSAHANIDLGPLFLPSFGHPSINYWYEAPHISRKLAFQ